MGDGPSALAGRPGQGQAAGVPADATRRRVAGLLVPAVLTLLMVAACTVGHDEDGTDGGAQLANPSAVFCEDQGGTYSLDDETCTLPDGSVVDAWDYYREQSSRQ